jgi:hypothetical protein
MPSYDFKHPEKEEYIELFFSMNEEKTYVDEEGVEWKRVFSSPNVNATNRSYDPSKPIYDEKGNKMKVVPITDELVRSQGFDNASDYIEWNNSMCDESKSPLANLDKAHAQAGDKNVQEVIKENNAKLKERAEQHSSKVATAKKSGKNVKIEATSNKRTFDSRNSSYSSLDKKIEAYDNYANSQRIGKIKVNDKVVSEVKPKKKK